MIRKAPQPEPLPEPTVGNNAGGQLRAFIERVLRLKEEQDALAADIREVYAEAKGVGFDKTAMGQLVAYLRKKEKNAELLQEQSALFDLYLSAYEDRPSHAHTREAKTNREARAKRSSNSEPGPDPQVPALPGGEASIPSSPAAGAKSDGLQSIADQGGAQAPVVIEDREGEQAATISEDDIPAFLRPTKMRPHCLNPDLCAGSGYNHCHRCKQAMAESGAAQ